MKGGRWTDLECEKCGQRVRLPTADLTFEPPERGGNAHAFLSGEHAQCPDAHGGNTYWLRVVDPANPVAP